MSFDDIPEDAEPSYPCAQYEASAPPEYLCGGNIVKRNGRWQCDRCDYDYGGDALTEPDRSEL